MSDGTGADDFRLIAYCGLYCGACSFKLAHDENDRRHLVHLPDKYEELKSAPAGFCAGCRLDEGCGECAIRGCAIAKHIAHCGECDEFPCGRLIAFQQDGVPHHASTLENLRELKRQGQDRWLADQRRLWQCQCGGKISWYLPTCIHCGKDRI